MSDQRPDIVVVLTDQMRRDAMNLCGDPNIHSPTLDAMARQGLIFDAMCSTFPACVPFRFSLMTGHFAHSRMVPSLGYRLSPAERTLGEAVKACGYQTAYIGKWHLYSLYGVTGGQSLAQANRSPIPRSHRRGFDHWRGFELRNDYDDTWIFQDDDPAPQRLAGYQTDALFDLTEQWLGTERHRPGFVVLSVEAPHPPFMAPQAAIDRVRDRGPYVSRANVDIDAITAFPPEWDLMLTGGMTMAQASGAQRRAVFEANMQGYCAMIEVIDARMADLIANARRRARPTIFVFLSDHGELGGSHGMLGKAEPYEESIAVPLIVHATDPALVPPGRSCAMPVGTEDLFPTLVGLAGGGKTDVPGLDLSGLISGTEGAPEREGVLLQFVAELRPSRRYYDETWRGIRTRNAKYAVIGNADGVRPWLHFDLATDPFEQRNLVETGERAADLEGLHQNLMRLIAETGDDFPIRPFV